MKHLFENETDYEYEHQDLDDSMMSEDWCGFGTCQNDCTLSCTSTGWCFNNIGR